MFKEAFRAGKLRTKARIDTYRFNTKVQNEKELTARELPLPALQVNRGFQ